MYTDNAAVARFLQRTIEVLLYKDFADESLPLIDAEFERPLIEWSGESRVDQSFYSMALADVGELQADATASTA